MKLYLLQCENTDEMPRRAIICGIFSNSRLATLSLLEIATLDRAEDYENNLDGLEKDLLQGGTCLGHGSFLPVTSENYLKEWEIVVKDINTLVENASLVQVKPISAHIAPFDYRTVGCTTTNYKIVDGRFKKIPFNPARGKRR